MKDFIKKYHTPVTPSTSNKHFFAYINKYLFLYNIIHKKSFDRIQKELKSLFSLILPSIVKDWTVNKNARYYGRQDKRTLCE